MGIFSSQQEETPVETNTEVENAVEAVAQENLEQVETSEVVEAPAASPEEIEGATASVRIAERNYALLNSPLFGNKFDRQSDALRQTLETVSLFHDMNKIVEEHNFSAALVATMMAVPAIAAVVKDFPELSQFSVVPEHHTSANAVAGMESLQTATQTVSGDVKTKMNDLIDTFEQSLNSIPGIVAKFNEHLNDDMVSLEESDVSEEVLSDLPVVGINMTDINMLLTLNNDSLAAVSVFDNSSLVANPETLVNEITGMESLVDANGAAFGLTMDKTGLRNADRSEVYIPTMSTFGELGIDGNGVGLIVNQTQMLLENLSTVAGKKDEIVASLRQAAEELPDSFLSDDVTYGLNDHAVLFNSYVTLNNTLLRQSVQTAALVFQMIDGVFVSPDGGAVVIEEDAGAEA